MCNLVAWKRQKSIELYSTPNEAEQEFEQIQLNVKQEKTTVTSWHTLFLEKYRSLVIAGIGVAVFQQFQGANAIFYYIPLIVEKATGHAASDALMWPIIQGIILVAGSLLFFGYCRQVQSANFIENRR